MTNILHWIAERCDQTYKKGNWAGRGVLPAIDGISAEMAHWRPHPEQHTIAEIVLHMAYWKDAAGARMAGRPWTHDEQLDWRPVPTTEQGWGQARAELQAAHERVMADLRALSDDRLLTSLGKGWWAETATLRVIDLAVDVASHDLYHAAQIFVLKRLSAARRDEDLGPGTRKAAKE